MRRFVVISIVVEGSQNTVYCSSMGTVSRECSEWDGKGDWKGVRKEKEDYDKLVFSIALLHFRHSTVWGMEFEDMSIDVAISKRYLRELQVGFILVIGSLTACSFQRLFEDNLNKQAVNHLKRKGRRCNTCDGASPLVAYLSPVRDTREHGKVREADDSMLRRGRLIPVNSLGCPDCVWTHHNPVPPYHNWGHPTCWGQMAHLLLLLLLFCDFGSELCPFYSSVKKNEDWGSIFFVKTALFAIQRLHWFWRVSPHFLHFWNKI